ncbi:ribosome-inactivating family protein [Streptomyces sp. NPDC060027]|uniref:ribosome-inactivating family protein n=1 Tax=Streptomyces sp. NPDC060027 TaxID=3347040 RepID=UPI0036747D39
MSARLPAGGYVKRLMVLLLSLVAVLGMTQVRSIPLAHAATSNYWSPITWNITGLGNGSNREAERNYRAMVNQLRVLSGYDIGTGLMRTTEQTQRYIEVMIVDNGDPVNNHRISLYLRLDNLYLDGFTIVGQNYRFSDAPGYLTTRFANQYPGAVHLFRNLPYTSHYQDLANAGTRGSQAFSGPSFWTAIQTIQRLTDQNWNNARAALAAIIGATSEAARFGWIENRIANSIGSGGETDDAGGFHNNLGGFGADLENNWEDLSEIVYRQQNGNGRIEPVNIDGHRYSSISDIIYSRGSSGPRLAPFLTHGSAR